MPLIAVTASSEKHAQAYAESIKSRGADVRLLTPGAGLTPAQALDGVGGILLSGGPDVHPQRYGQQVDPAAHVKPDQSRDEMEFALVPLALSQDMPVLGICRGMQVLNVTFGGSLIQDIPDHQAAVHSVFVSPGSKLGAIIGAGGYFRTNSRHHQGLRDAHRARDLLASAYMPDDGIIEALESPAHSWVVGVQCHPEREDEVPRGFLNLFDGLVQWAERFAETGHG